VAFPAHQLARQRPLCCSASQSGLDWPPSNNPGKFRGKACSLRVAARRGRTAGAGDAGHVQKGGRRTQAIMPPSLRSLRISVDGHDAFDPIRFDSIWGLHGLCLLRARGIPGLCSNKKPAHTPLSACGRPEHPSCLLLNRPTLVSCMDACDVIIRVPKGQSRGFVASLFLGSVPSIGPAASKSSGDGRRGLGCDTSARRNESKRADITIHSAEIAVQVVIWACK
jgi:hypothetical protein